MIPERIQHPISLVMHVSAKWSTNICEPVSVKELKIVSFWKTLKLVKVFFSCWESHNPFRHLFPNIYNMLFITSRQLFNSLFIFSSLEKVNINDHLVDWLLKSFTSTLQSRVVHAKFHLSSLRIQSEETFLLWQSSTF